MATETTGRVHEGWLEKEGSWMKSWKNRYCILDTDQQLSYYTDQNLTEKKGVVDLNEMTEHKERDDPNKMQFGFEIVCKSRHWFLKTSTRQDAIEWIGAITRCTDTMERETRLGWSVKDKVEVFSQSKDKWCLGYIKRVDRHVVCVSYSVGEEVKDQLTKEVRVFDAAIRKPSPEAVRRDEEKKKKIAQAKQERIEKEAAEKKEEEDGKKREVEEKRLAKVAEEQAKQRAQEEEQLKVVEAQASKQQEEEARKKNGDCPAYEGMKITAFWRDTKNEAHNGWYAAIVETVNGDDTFNIMFNDGHRRANVLAEDIEDLKEWAKEKKAKEQAANPTPDAEKVDTATVAGADPTNVAAELMTEDAAATDFEICFCRMAGFSGAYWMWKNTATKANGHNSPIDIPAGSNITITWEGDVADFYLRDMSTGDGGRIADGKSKEGDGSWTPECKGGTVKLEVWKTGGAKGDRSKQAFDLNVTA